jgi:hypothetical protein
MSFQSSLQLRNVANIINFEMIAILILHINFVQDAHLDDALCDVSLVSLYCTVEPSRHFSVFGSRGVR